MSKIKSVEGKVCLVTGGASGLGLGAVTHLLAHGARCLIFDLPNSPGAQGARELAAATSDNRCRFIPGNVCSEVDVKAALEDIARHECRLDVCLSNAAVFQNRFHPVFDFNTGAAFPLEEFRRVMEVNVVGSFNVLRLAAGMIGRNEVDSDGERGVILLTGSISGRPQIIQPNMIAYTTSKAAVNGMTSNLAGDLYMRGIRVCTISPASFESHLIEHIPGAEVDPLVASQRGNVFPKRCGDPEAEFGACVRFCIENALLNGSIISLDGASRYNIPVGN